MELGRVIALEYHFILLMEKLVTICWGNLEYMRCLLVSEVTLLALKQFLLEIQVISKTS